jgi:hypothetical protein
MPKYSVTPSARKQRRAETAKREVQEREAAERLEAKWDEEDAVVYRGSAITLRAEGLAAEMATGSAKLTDVREMLATDFSAEPYADLSVLQTQALLMGLDPETGDPHFAAVALYRAHGTTADAYVLPTSLYLWRQDADFRDEFGDDDDAD